MTIIQANKFWFPRGGAERYALDLSARLAAAGDTVIPFAMRHPDNLPTPYASFFPSFVETEKVRFGPSGLRTLKRMVYSGEAKRDMRELLREIPVDLCHVHNIYTQISPSILDALHDRGVPTVMTVHDYHLVSPAYSIWAEGCGPQVNDRSVIKATMQRFHKRSYAASFAQAFAFSWQRRTGVWRRGIKLFLTPSEFLRRRMLAAGFPADRVRTLPLGIDPAAVKARSDHDGYVLAVGRLVPEKGMDTVVDLARLLPDVQFRIVGTGEDEERLHARSRHLANLRFMGYRSGADLDELYRGAAAVLIPSRWEEVFGLTALEAMRAGKPVIASHVGGLPEIVQDRLTGILVNPLDTRGWAEAVLRVLHDDAMRRRLGREGRVQLENRFSVRLHDQRLREIYAEVMQTKNRPG